MTKIFRDLDDPTFYFGLIASGIGGAWDLITNVYGLLLIFEPTIRKTVSTPITIFLAITGSNVPGVIIAIILAFVLSFGEVLFLKANEIFTDDSKDRVYYYLFLAVALALKAYDIYNTYLATKAFMLPNALRGGSEPSLLQHLVLLIVSLICTVCPILFYKLFTTKR